MRNSCQGQKRISYILKPKVLETIQISVNEYAELEGTRQEPNYFEWSILNENEEVIFSGFENSSSIVWIPDSAGYFIIKVKIGYDNNKSITTLKEIVVLESPQSLQKSLLESGQEMQKQCLD